MTDLYRSSVPVVSRRPLHLNVTRLRHIAVVALCLLTVARLPAAITGLVHHWNFDEGQDWHDSAFQSSYSGSTAYDSVGSANATLQNMGSTNWVSGRQFTALAFDGVNEHLLVTTNLAASLGGTASLSFWIRTSQTGAVAVADAPGIAGAAGAGGVQWGWIDDAGRIGLAVDNTLVVRSTNPINDNQWHHIVFTRDAGTGAGQVFVDGVLVQSAAGPTGVKSSPFTSLARIENGGSANYFRGRLDQVTILDHLVTPAGVATLRTNHAPKLWDTRTEGVDNRPFITRSALVSAFDVENDPISVRSWTQPAHGTVVNNGDGSFTFTPTGGYLGADSFTVVIQDGQGGFHRGTMNVTIMSEPPGGGGVPVTQFTGFSALQTNGVDLSHNGWRTPRAVDWNVDGKLDLLVGTGGYVVLYTNNGSVNVPDFVGGGRVRAGGADIATGTSQSSLALVDMTGDGVRDLVVADSASKLRVYRNLAASNATPNYTTPVFVKNAAGADFILPDRRFDLGDWNGDGKPDLVTGSFSGAMRLYLNVGTAADPRFDTSTTLFSDSYNIFPRLFDLNGNGLVDLLRGINWGDIRYWRDAGSLGLGSSVTLSLSDSNGVSPDLHALTDGAMVDFGDYNGDGTLDLLVGGHSGDKLYLAYGVKKTIAESIAEIEAIYDANPTDVGVALSANTNALLNVLNNANWNLITHLQNGTLGTREALFAALTNHIGKYWFLKYQTLDTTNFHHVPSIVCQNWVMLQYVLADTPTRRNNIADVLGLAGTARLIYLENGLALGDNAKSKPAAYGTLLDFRRRHPRELFPDAIMTFDQLYGDNRGGFIWTPNSTKNTFGDWALGNANEWAGDLTAAIEKVLGAGRASGDYYTFVMGHEVTHSLDAYVNGRANTDLRRRWGLTLCTAAGPDVIPGANGWRDTAATKTNFLAKGYWDGVEANWNAAWSNYWSVGVGAPFRNTSFMRGSIDWFLDNSQESLATQANHYWANAWGRLIGATDRFRRASGPGLGPLRANINEVVTFIDFESAGMNKVNLVETKYQSSPAQVNWTNHYADLERDDRGYIQRLKVEGQTYEFQYDTSGVVTNVLTSLLSPQKDYCWTFRNQSRQFDVLRNDSRLEGGPVQLAGVSAPAHGTVSTNADGTIVYTPALNYVGNDSFNYTVTSTNTGGSATSTVYVEVINPTVPTGDLLVEYWLNIGGGSAVSDLTGNANFPNSPTLRYYTNSAFELRSNYGDNYGSRVRGQFTAPVAGDYTFWIASDDGGELWFSPNPDAANKTLIAYETAWAGPREWTKYASQQSAPITLAAGQVCYLETLQKEGNGGDNLAVAWRGPAPYNTTNVIAAAYLQQPFAGFSIPQFLSDPLAKPPGTVDAAYAGSLDSDVTDTNANEILTFAKLSGPAWLSVAANGALTGTPGAGDAGTNSFVVRVVDSTGFADETVVRVSVQGANVPPVFTVWERSGDTLLLSGLAGALRTCVLETTTNLTALPIWTAAATNVAGADGTFQFTDTQTGPSQKFYRVSGK